MKKKVKRYAEGEEVKIEDRSTKSSRLMEEERAKAPMDYAGLGGRSRATSMMSGPVLGIKERKTENEPEIPEKDARPGAGFNAKRYLEEIESKGGGPRSETGPDVKKSSRSTPAKYSGVVKANELGSQNIKFPKNMESGSDVMKRGRASTDGSGSSPLEKYTRDKETRATRDKRKMDFAVDRVKAGVGFKSGGSASSRADGIAQRGKTRGRVC